MTCPDENDLVLLADRAISDKRRISIDRHLDGCGPCTLLVAALADMAAPVRPVPARYKIIRQVGAGAMGVVWEAEDTNLGRRVALKFVRPDDDTVGERRARLVREARALAQLRHPNVVSVYDVGDAGRELFLALELVVGTDARTWRTLPRSTADILGVWRQVASGLAAVHRAGIVHRDIKPDNVLVADDGRVLLGDFGLATDRFEPEIGATAGTSIYMAYEQLVGQPATPKSDQYALCVSIWEALVGTRPFVGPTLAATAIAMERRLEPPANMRPHIYAALARGLDPDPARRWPTIDALIAALDGATRKRIRPLWLALGAALLAAVGTISVLAWRDSSSAHASAPPPWTVTPDARFEAATPTERAPH
jgi:serine/threonine protein kinase